MACGKAVFKYSLIPAFIFTPDWLEWTNFAVKFLTCKWKVPPSFLKKASSIFALYKCENGDGVSREIRLREGNSRLRPPLKLRHLIFPYRRIMFGPAFSGGIHAGFVNLFLRNLAKGFALPHFSYDRFFLLFPILAVIQFLRQVSDFGGKNALKIKLGYRRLK